MEETSQVSVKTQQKENQDNESQESSDKRPKKAEKLAALEKEFNCKMRLRRIEFEMKQKEIEMELRRLEEELKLQHEKMPETLVLMMVRSNCNTKRCQRLWF